MARNSKPDPADALEAIAAALRDYVTCLRFAEWLVDNKLIATGTATDTRPEALAYGYAIRFSQHQPRLDKIIAEGRP